MYSMAPAAKLRHKDMIWVDIDPMMAPKKAPIPVVMPDSTTQKMTFPIFMPPFFMGTAIDIPSGISCRHMAIARLNPNFIEASKPEPNG